MTELSNDEKLLIFSDILETKIRLSKLEKRLDALLTALNVQSQTIQKVLNVSIQSTAERKC